MDQTAARLEEDSQARERALAPASFIVEAPAGAGKTELLTQRYLRLLALVEHPEEVLALTFTNKAATEMRDRILGSLESAARAAEPADSLPPHKRQTRRLALAVLAHDAACRWGLLDHPGRLRITTLDALSAGLARQMPFLSRFGSQPAVTDEAETHYATAARRTLELVEADTPDAEVVAQALAFMDNDAGRLEKLLIAMLGKRDQWLAHTVKLGLALDRDSVEAGFAALIARDLDRAAALMSGRLQGLLMPLARFAAANAPGFCDPLADWQTPLTSSIADLPRWQALASLLLTAQGSVRKQLTKNNGFPAGKEFAEQKAAMLERLDEVAAIGGLAEALAALPALPQPQLSDAEWQTVACFGRLLLLATAQLWLAFQERGEVDFIAVAERASEALGEDDAPTDVALALDYRLSHLLIDEFQDTSPGQVKLIEKLMRGWQAGDGRTVFVVGDPMQSIYRFRKADVGLFLQVRAEGLGGQALEHLRLFRNNRSWPAVVDWVNQVFPGIFPSVDERREGAVRYAASAASRAPRDDAGVALHPVIVDDDQDGEAEEARQVLALIRQARAAAPGERVAVLVRARRHLDALVAELRRAAPEIAFQAVDIEGLADRQHVQDLLTLFNALHHRADRVHWLALLRAPWCGLTLADLHALAADDRQQTIWQLMHDAARVDRLSEDGRQRLLHLRSVLEVAFAGRGRQPERRWLEATWLMLGGPACLEAPAALADVEAFFALVDRLTAQRRLDAETLTAQAGELFAPVDPLGDAVQMMTIHKSKGLEFDTVIVPGLHRDAGGQDASLLLWEDVPSADGESHLLVAPMRAKGDAPDGATLHDYLRRLENKRGAHEDERLLYVAVTRAIRRLHLVGVARRDADKPDGVKAPASGSLLRLLWPGYAAARFAEAAAQHVSQVRLPGLDSAVFEPPLLRLRAPAWPAALMRQPDDWQPLDNPTLDDDAPAGATLEASIGTLVHRCLELIARDGLAAWTAARLAAALPGWRRWLQARGHDDAEAAEGAAQVSAALSTTLASEAGRWVLAAHPESGAEQAWSSVGERGVTQHVIDRCFVADGIRWIIDYKTVRADPDELPARAETHRAQLERYASLFAGDARPLRLAIYFPCQGQLVALEDFRLV